MSNKIRRTMVVAISLVVLGVTASACSEIAPPDEVGLYYMKGEIDGNKFGHCIDPGSSDDWIANNEVVFLPNNLRTWNIAPTGGDSNVPITVSSKPEPNQPSGVQVNVWFQTNFKLNTSCEGGANSPLVQWWESQGRRYQANTTAGWKAMLESTIVTALTTSSRNVIRGYSADELVAGTKNQEVQTAIAAAFQADLKPLIGGDFFCGPSFDRLKPACPPVEVLVKDVDYTDAGIQDARNAKVKALENAAAQVAEAEGKVKAANAQQALYQNEAWLALEVAKLKLQQVQACAANPNCTVILGADDNVIVNTK